MLFRMIYDETLAQAAYLIGCQKSGEAIIIDPERDVDRYVRLAERHGLRITAVTETHIHADFLSGSRELAERTGAVLYLSDEGGADWKYRWLDKKSGGGVYAHKLLKDGDTFDVGKIRFRVVHTPGHTPEHISFLVIDRGAGRDEPIGIATGDFVFVGDLGRPDLLETAAGVKGAKENSARTLARSASRLLELPDFVQVWPAHGAGSACGKALGAVPQSTVGYERLVNEALRLATHDEEEFVEFILSGQPEPPLYFARMKRENRDGVPVLGELPCPHEMPRSELGSVDGRQVAIVDTRAWSAFRAGHLPGALHAPFGPLFPSVVGSYVEPEEEIVLVVEDAHRLDEAIRNCLRIGLDRITRYVTADRLGEWADAESREGDHPLATILDIGPEVLREQMGDDELAILDVRGAAEHADGAIPGSINIAHTRLAERLGEAPAGKRLIVHCAAGIRSAAASAFLRRAGFDVVNLTGGFGAWERAGGKIVKPQESGVVHAGRD
jgi:hydroxyacylglutathione hydrolase